MSGTVTVFATDTTLSVLVAGRGRVRQWAAVPLEAGLVKDGVVAEKDKLSEKVRRLFHEQRIRTKKVVAGASGLHCLARVIEVPRLPGSVLGEAVRREAEMVLPVPLEQVYLSWQVMGDSPDGAKVFLAAAPRNSVDALFEALRAAGLKPVSMDMAPLALARAANATTALLADVRAAEMDIVILVDGAPLLVRSSSYSAEVTGVQEKLLAVKEELERAVNYYDSAHPDRALEQSLPVYVAGRLVQEPAACQFLAGELGRPVLPLASPFKAPSGFPAGQYMVNVGLALKKTRPGRWTSPSAVDFNALPESYRPPKFSWGRGFGVPAGTVAAIVLLGMVVLQVREAAARTDMLQGQLDAANKLLERKVAQQVVEKRESAEQTKRLAQLEATYKAVAVQVDNFSLMRDDFGRLAEGTSGDIELSTIALSQGVTLERVTRGGDGMTVQGVATGEDEVLDYASALRASKRFSRVIVSSLREGEEGFGFILTLTASE